MTERERLEEILLKMPIYEFVRYDEASSDTVYDIKKLADYLLNNGVIVPPCKVGDTIYVIPSRANWRINNMYESMKPLNRIYEQTVDEIHIYQSGYTVSSCEGIQHQPSVLFGETWFLTREEAEKALKEREENA